MRKNKKSKLKTQKPKTKTIIVHFGGCIRDSNGEVLQLPESIITQVKPDGTTDVRPLSGKKEPGWEPGVYHKKAQDV